VVRATVAAEVLKQLLARQVAAPANDSRQSGVRDSADLPNAAFAAKADQQRLSLDRDVAIAKRAQAVRMIGANVFGIAHAQRGSIEKLNHGGQHLLARQVRPQEIGLNLLADERQGDAESRHAGKLFFGPALGPGGVIPVLLAAAGIATRRLNVAVFKRANPNGLPGRRNDDSADAIEHDLASDQAARGIPV